jgi:hypothetical protein
MNEMLEKIQKKTRNTLVIRVSLLLNIAKRMLDAPIVIAKPPHTYAGAIAR